MFLTGNLWGVFLKISYFWISDRCLPFFLELINSLKSLISQNIEMDFNISAHPWILCMIQRVLCKWNTPPSLLSLVLGIMIMRFRDREVIAVNPVLSKQKHKRHKTRIAKTQPTESHLWQIQSQNLGLLLAHRYAIFLCSLDVEI